MNQRVGGSRSLRDLASLEGRVAAITGGAGHLGRVLAASLAECGAAIAIIDVREDDALRVATSIAEAHGVPSVAILADLEQSADVETLPRAIVERLGRLDILVNNAALVGTSEVSGWSVLFGQQSINTWRRALEINLTAAFALTQRAASLLAASGQGSVVNIGSIYGMVGPDWRLYEGTAMGNPAAYAASKGGLLQLTRWLATTLAPQIRVNMISPGGVFRATPEPFYSRYVARTPLGRMATEEDFKGAIAYLASDLSSYVTGQNLAVDGGWTAW